MTSPAPRQTPREAIDAAAGRCLYCGKALRKNQRPYVARFYADGSYFVGHKTCYGEMTAPDYARSTRDIGVGR